MKIKELGLLHFGKFSNKTVKLEDGINLINGKNESGKSTTFSFITGMLYGFSKDSKSRRLYDENKDKYKPWSGESYNGYMEMSGENDFRIERDFNEDTISFINLTNGKDLSDDEKLKEFSRIKQPGAYIFNVNKDFFINTVFIGQLATKIDENSYDVLRNKMLNIHKTNDESVNVRKACEILENSLKNMGKATRKTSEIGALSAKAENTENQIVKLEEETSEYGNLLKELSATEDNLNKLYSEKDYYEKIKEQKLYNEVLEKEQEIKKLRETSGSVSYEDYENILNIEKEIYSIDDELNSLNRKLMSLSSLKKTLNKREIEDDYNKVLLYKGKSSDSYDSDREAESLRNEIRNNRGMVQKLMYMMISSLIVIAVILAVSVFTKRYYINIISILAVFFIYLKLTKYKVNKEVGSHLERKKQELDSKDLIGRSGEYSAILEKYASDDDNIENCLKDMIKEAEFEEFSLKSATSDRENIKNKINEKISRKIELGSMLDSIAEKYGISDIEILKEYLIDNSDRRNEEKIKSVEKLINVMLDGRKKEDLNHNIKYENMESSFDDILIREEETKRIKLKERIAITDTKIKKLESLKENLSYVQNSLYNLENKKKNTEKALNAITELLDDNRDDILPDIISKMNYIISRITDGRYSKVLLDNNFNIKIKDESANSFVDLKYLSKGTEDQIYFAFRIAMSELLLEDAPVIMDDHFLQYDDERLENTLKFINELKDRRQILMFSATDREKECLNRLNIKYNYINLN